MRCLLLVIALCATAFAHAPGETPPRIDDGKSIATAYLVALAAIGLPLATSAIGVPEDEGAHPNRAAVFGMIGIAGIVLGPSAGHWYAGKAITTGLVLRSAGAAGIAAMVITDPHVERFGMWIVGGIVTVGLWETGVIWDVVTLPRAVRSHNRKLQVAPVVAPHTTGLAFAGTF